MKGILRLIEACSKKAGLSVLGLLGLALIPTTTLAQTQPVITWSYSGTLTAQTSSYPYPYVRQITSASDMSFSSSTFGPKSITLNAVVTATVTWPEGVTVPEKQWLKLYLKANSGLYSGAAGTVSASNGWVDTATGTSGYTALSEGRHLICRKPSGRQLVLTYPIQASLAGVSYSTGTASVGGEMRLELTDRKLELSALDCLNWWKVDDGTWYVGHTTAAYPSGALNQRQNTATISGAWNWTTNPFGYPDPMKGVDLTCDSTGAMTMQFEATTTRFSNPTTHTDPSLMFYPVFNRNMQFKYKAIDVVDGYSFECVWEWLLHYVVEDYMETDVSPYFLLQDTLPMALFSGANGNGSFTFTASYETEMTYGTQFTTEVQVSAGLIEALQIAASIGRTETYEFSTTKGTSFSLNIPVGQDPAYYVLGVGLPHFVHYGTATLWSVNGTRADNRPVFWAPAPDHAPLALMAVKLQNIQGIQLPYDAPTWALQ